MTFKISYNVFTLKNFCKTNYKGDIITPAVTGELTQQKEYKTCTPKGAEPIPVISCVRVVFYCLPPHMHTCLTSLLFPLQCPIKS